MAEDTPLGEVLDTPKTDSCSNSDDSFTKPANDTATLNFCKGFVKLTVASTIGHRYSAIGVQRSAFNIRHLAFGLRPSPFALRGEIANTKDCMNKTLRTLVIGVGNMGSSHARAYYQSAGFEVAGLVARRPEKREALAKELGNVPQFAEVDEALKMTQPDAVAVCSYPDTHKKFTIKALRAGAHVFAEKPLAETVADAQEIVELANKLNKKVVVGYILRVHPAWIKFIEIAQTLGKPLVMRMNLNQQSSGQRWVTHKELLRSMSPIVDCGVHYVDVMCQMTRSKPVQVQGIGARLSDEIAADMYNYGHLEVKFEDGSVGWYEAGWGPMISETAFFVKDVIGPLGCVSMVDPAALKKTDSSEIDGHTETNSLLLHRSACDLQGNFIKKDELLDTSDEPDHQELCNREQVFFLKAIRENIDLTDHLSDAVNSLRIVLAADESVRTGKVITLIKNI